MRPGFVAFLIVAGACGRTEPGVQPASEIIREVTTGMRAAHRVQLSVKAGAEEPTAEDLETRRRIEDEIERENIGRLVSSGGGAGEIWVVVEVENTAEAVPRMREILRAMGLARQASFKVIPKEE